MPATPTASGTTLTARIFRRGDANDTGERNIADAVATFGYLFLGSVDLPCHDAADTNDSGTLDISDGTYLLHWLFLGGPPPSQPLDCGGDTTLDTLGCDAFASCP